MAILAKLTHFYKIANLSRAYFFASSAPRRSSGGCWRSRRGSGLPLAGFVSRSALTASLKGRGWRETARPLPSL